MTNNCIHTFKVPWHENLTLRFSNINMSSPSLPMVPQWLKLAFGVKRALGVLLAFEIIGGSSALIWNVVAYVVTLQ